MRTAILLVEVAAVLGAATLIAARLIPAIFRMATTPVTVRRIARFKRIGRGYYATIALGTLYALSFFLELTVNDKALVICYDGRYAFPAIAEWVNSFNPFFTISSYARKADFGLFGDEPVDYRAFAAYCEDPGLLRAEAEAREEEWKAREALLRGLGQPPPRPEPVPEPPRFPQERPAEPGKDASAEDRAAYRARLEAWDRAVEDFEDENWEAFDACDAYRAAERKWIEHQFALEVLERLGEEVRVLKSACEAFAANKAWIAMPLCPYGPRDPLLDLPGRPPHAPSWWPYLKSALAGESIPGDPEERAKRKVLPIWSHPFGTTDNGLDVFPQLAYGFRLSVTFALVVASLGYAVGVVLGGIMGYYGGWTDILVQRCIEIYGSIPFLYAIMIMASIVRPGLFLLASMLVVLRSWIGITYYVRGEFYREKAKDYVQSAVGTGVSDWRVMVTHILPNSIVPIVTFAPFDAVSYILVLVSLDYLGLGLPPGTPSWGYLLGQGREYLTSYPHLILIPSIVLAGTLFCVVVIGEAVREAFDPKVFSRLR